MAERVVVTGGAGFIGSHLVQTLLEQGKDVTVVDDLSTGSRENISAFAKDIEFVEGSILDRDLLIRVFSGATWVFHQAAVASVPRSVRDPLASHETNATGTLNVLVAARDAHVGRVMYASSSAYYGDDPVLPKREDMPPNPLSPYALQKLSGEIYARQFHALYGLETVSLRYFNVYGPKQDPHSEYSAVIPKFIQMMKHGERPTIHGDGSASRAFVYVSDVVDANLRAACVPEARGEVFNIAGRGRTTLNDLVRTINVVLGSSLEPKYDPWRAGDILHSEADISKAERVLGYDPHIAFADGIAKTAATIE